MGKNPSDLSSAGGGKDKGKTAVGGEPCYTSNNSDGTRSGDSEREFNTNFEEFQSPNYLDPKVGSYRFNQQDTESEKTSSDDQFEVRFRKTPSFGFSDHFSVVGKRQMGANFQPEDTDSETDSGQFEVRFRKKPKIGFPHYFSEVDSQKGPGKRTKGGNLQLKNATIVRKDTTKRNKTDIPHLWKIHPRKDEVEPDGWTIEVTTRPGGRTKDKYYRHKDYNYTFRSKRQVNFFLDTGTIMVKNVPRTLQKISADPSGNVQGRGRPRTRIVAQNSDSSTSTSRGKAPASISYKLPPGFL